jgi:hypothetical protein
MSEMTQGMLWYDASGRPLAERAADAAAYYEKKYGSRPNRVVVNTTETGAPDQVGGMTVNVSRMVMANHLWIGMASHA